MPSRSRRIAKIMWFGVVTLILSLLPGGIWSALLVTNLVTSPAIPWAVIVMAMVLWLIWQYVGGRWWPRSTAEARRRALRARTVSGPVFRWALAAGILAIVALGGFWIVLFQLIPSPGNTLPDLSQYPWLTVALALVMAALVGAVTEEAGFRGYFQSFLERELSGPAAIVLAALALAPGHGLTQGFVWSTLLFYFLVDVMFGVTAYLAQSILPGIVVHTLGLLTFFTLVWPHDAGRRLVSQGGADIWFWVHAAQVLIFGLLSVLAFRRLAQTAGRPPAKQAPRAGEALASSHG